MINFPHLAFFLDDEKKQKILKRDVKHPPEDKNINVE